MRFYTRQQGSQRGIETHGVRLHIAEAGPEGGPPVLLLHGFPEFWYGWRHQIEPLAAALLPPPPRCQPNRTTVLKQSK